jgi:hypothetical protein
MPIAAGQSTYTGTATSVTFTDRYGYLAVTNLSSTNKIWVLAGAGNVPTGTSIAPTGVAIEPGATVMVANGDIYWNQTRRVIQAGSIQVGNGAAYNASTNPSTPTNPGTLTPMEALDGQSANPGSTLNFAGTLTDGYAIVGAG